MMIRTINKSSRNDHNIARILKEAKEYSEEIDRQENEAWDEIMDEE